MPSDQELIRSILIKGSKASADNLVRRYYDELYNYLYCQVGKREDALDLTQEAFIAALNGLSSYDATKAGFRTWLYRIGTYKVIDFRRKYHVQWFTLAEEEWVEHDNLDEKLYQRDKLKEVNHYIANYQPSLQEIFHLRVYGKLSFPEIAALLDEPTEKIKAQYYRLIKRIREEIIHE